MSQSLDGNKLFISKAHTKLQRTGIHHLEIPDFYCHPISDISAYFSFTRNSFLKNRIATSRDVFFYFLSSFNLIFCLSCFISHSTLNTSINRASELGELELCRREWQSRWMLLNAAQVTSFLSQNFTQLFPIRTRLFVDTKVSFNALGRDATLQLRPRSFLFLFLVMMKCLHIEREPQPTHMWLWELFLKERLWIFLFFRDFFFRKTENLVHGTKSGFVWVARIVATDRNSGEIKHVDKKLNAHLQLLTVSA